MTNDMMTPQWEMDGEDLLREYREKQTVKKTFGKIGFALFVMMTVWVGFTLLTAIVVGVASVGAPFVLDFYNEYALIFNELGLALGVAASLLVLRDMPQVVPARQPFTVGRFMKLLSIAFAVSSVGNWIGTFVIGIWNGATGSEVTNEVIDMVMETDPWISFLAVGLAAPFLEEFFFRKLLIDRLRPMGELAAVMTSASLFALFHGNFSQLFYAFGAGVLLSYLYLRSGSFFLTFLFHAVFNTVSGVLPMIFMEDVLAFTEQIEELTEETLIEMMPSLFEEYGGALLYYGFHLMLIGVMSLLGLIFFFSAFRKTKLEKSGTSLSRKAFFGTAIKNAGMILALAFLLVMMALSLIQF